MFIVARPQIAEDVLTPIRSKFTIEPLEPGFGYTVGNSLRRTLLSSIPGAAISSVRIDGVLHEFSMIPKVTEDVTDVILNLKELVVRSDLEEPTTVYLKAKGPAEVTAGDIAPPAGVEILNPDLHIATLGKGASVEMEMTVERGVGYRMADKNKKPREPIGVIPVDSIFSPGPPDPRRRDRRVGDPARSGGIGRRRPPGARHAVQRARRGRQRHRGPGRGRRGPGRLRDHDRRAQPVGSFLQLPEA